MATWAERLTAATAADEQASVLKDLGAELKDVAYALSGLRVPVQEREELADRLYRAGSKAGAISTRLDAPSWAPGHMRQGKL